MKSVTVLRLAAFVFLSFSIAGCGGEPDQTAVDTTETVSDEAQESAVAGQRETGVAPETFELENGMQVVVIPDRRVGVVTHMVWYKIGGADEPPGKSGIAHFLEHLMFKRNSENPARRVFKNRCTKRRP